MKKISITFFLIFSLVASIYAQTTVRSIRVVPIAATIIVQSGTKYFNAKHTAKAWLTNTPGKGLTLNFETDALVTSASIEATDKVPYHNGSGIKQTTDFSNGPVKTYTFYLDSPAYKGHKAYILGLVTPDVHADAGLYWNCLVVRK